MLETHLRIGRMQNADTRVLNVLLGKTPHNNKQTKIQESWKMVSQKKVTLQEKFEEQYHPLQTILMNGLQNMREIVVLQPNTLQFLSNNQ